MWLLLPALWCYGQSASINEHGFYIPQNLTEANEQLDKVLTEKAKAKFRRLTPSDFENISGLFILGEWELGELETDANSRLVQYLNTYVNTKQEAYGYEGWQVRRHLVLLSYLRHLQHSPFDLAVEAKKLAAKGDSVARVIEQQNQRNLVADSIQGIYIPRNLADSFVQLDKMLAEPIKEQLRHPDPEYGLAKFHFGLGLWMRNNWGLWGDSRLQQYFEELNITHPDDMSGVLLKSYSDYLNGKPLDENQYRRAAIPRVADNPELDSAAAVSLPRPKLKRSDYSKPYRQFLRKRRIDDFHELPPEAYGQESEIVEVTE
ncbi:DUF6794 domain-containing protein [Hymenobacter sp. DG01]|uniref:DUF6794 domain-containing protein n=1 Tax=Hymenobacter sp. DG01 TaxID=2584940 RepID=UPI00112439D5|nr:DUF6794 domain-containing protein [Hymenobacter sp. DG01]